MEGLEIIVSDNLWTTLLIALAYSPVQMALVQKLKLLPFVKNGVGVWVVNLISSIFLGYFFTYTFYVDLSVFERIWVGVFAFLGAIGIYEFFKASTIIPYTPRPKPDDNVCVPKENEIEYERGNQDDL